jgi:hypothetical protein
LASPIRHSSRHFQIFKNTTSKIYLIANKAIYIKNTSQAEDRDQQQAQVLHLSKLKISHLEKAYGVEVSESAKQVLTTQYDQNIAYTRTMMMQITNTSPSVELLLKSIKLKLFRRIFRHMKGITLNN